MGAAGPVRREDCGHGFWLATGEGFETQIVFGEGCGHGGQPLWRHDGLDHSHGWNRLESAGDQRVWSTSRHRNVYPRA